MLLRCDYPALARIERTRSGKRWGELFSRMDPSQKLFRKIRQFLSYRVTVNTQKQKKVDTDATD
jgi:hypothetical protein